MLLTALCVNIHSLLILGLLKMASSYNVLHKLCVVVSLRERTHDFRCLVAFKFMSRMESSAKGSQKSGQCQFMLS